MSQRTIFFSYSHKDEELRNQLEVHLSPLKRQGIISAWHDKRITAGQYIDDEISRHLAEADIILLLVSSDFIASDYCYHKEVMCALERHRNKQAVLIPVILRPCDWHDMPFGNLLATPNDGKPVTKYPNIDDAFLEIVNAIKGAIDFMTSSQPESIDSAKISMATPDNTLPNIGHILSSNLRIKSYFTDHDKREFILESFKFIAKFFEASLKELENRYTSITTEFRMIDANSFTAVAYYKGKEKTKCGVWLSDSSSSFINGILYSSSGVTRNSWNESLDIEDGEYMLFLKPMGMHFFRQSNNPLTQEGAAEYYWEIFISPMQ